MIKHIPNLVTLLNLCSGCIAVIVVIQGQLVWGAFFVFIGIVLDFLDGFLARMLRVQSDLGLQLDSLADVVTSGVVPGLVMYKLLCLALNVSDELIDPGHWAHQSTEPFSLRNLLPLLGLIIAMASAYRLGKFNLDAEQQDYFKGLPTPANTLLIMSLPLILEYQGSGIINAQILNPYVLIVLCLVSAYLLNAPIKLFSLKFKTYGFSENTTRYIFLALSVVLLAVLQFAAIPLIIVMYIIMSLLTYKAKTTS